MPFLSFCFNSFARAVLTYHEALLFLVSLRHLFSKAYCALAGLGAVLPPWSGVLVVFLANLLLSYGGRRSRASHPTRQKLNKFVPFSSARRQICPIFVRQETNLSLSRPPGDKFAGPGGHRGRAGPELREGKFCSQRSGRFAPGGKLLLPMCHPAPFGGGAGGAGRGAGPGGGGAEGAAGESRGKFKVIC